MQHGTHIESQVFEFQSKLLVCHPRDIVSSIRSKEFKPMDDHVLHDLQTELLEQKSLYRVTE